MNIIHLNQPISDKQRAEHCFSGDLVIYKNIPAMHELIVYADRMLRKAFAGIEPLQVQEQFTPEEFLQFSGKAQTQFRNSQKAKELFFNVLAQCGVDLKSTYYDHFPMRIVPYGDKYNGARNSYIGHHRDSWGSNIHSQINWWAPLYELEEERTIGIYPDYWKKPIANNTATWSFKTYMEKLKEVESGRKGSYPSAPTPKEAVDENNILKVMLEPGDILSFSSAHLHASVPNTTLTPRYSVEMRTINMGDLVADRAAPNVDNSGEKPMYQWFKNILNKNELSV